MFDRRLWRLKERHHITMVLPFLLADEGLTAEEIEFAIERFTGYPVRLDRLKLLFDSEGRRKKWKIDKIPLSILKEIKRLRESEEYYGYRRISREIHRRFDFYISAMTVRELFEIGIDQIITEREEEEKRLAEIEKKVNEGKVAEISLKELVWFAMRRNNDTVNAEIERRLNRLIKKAEKLTVLDVL